MAEVGRGSVLERIDQSRSLELRLCTEPREVDGASFGFVSDRPGGSAGSATAGEWEIRNRIHHTNAKQMINLDSE